MTKMAYVGCPIDFSEVGLSSLVGVSAVTKVTVYKALNYHSILGNE